MSKTVISMMGVLALAGTTALAQSTTTTSGQASGTSGQSSSSQGSDRDKTSGQTGQSGHAGHGTMAGDSDSKASSTSSSQANLAAADRKFVETAARGGLAEVELGRLASEKASSPEVKAFGQMMVDDHTKANDELKELAQQKGLTLPTETDKAHQALVSKLQNTSGAEFDRMFMKEMVKDHKKDVAEFQKAARSAKDEEVKSWAAKKVPTLEQHLQHAQQAANMGSAAGSTSATSTSSDATKSTTSKSKDKNNPDDSSQGMSDTNKKSDKKKKSGTDEGTEPAPDRR